MRFGGFFSWTSESLVLKSAREDVWYRRQESELVTVPRGWGPDKTLIITPWVPDIWNKLVDWDHHQLVCDSENTLLLWTLLLQCIAEQLSQHVCDIIQCSISDHDLSRLPYLYHLSRVTQGCLVRIPHCPWRIPKWDAQVPCILSL